MGKLSFLTIFFLLSVSIIAQNINSKVELIKERDFSNGIGLVGENSANVSIIDTLYPFGKGKSKSSWGLAQWFSRFNIKGVKPEILNDSVIYANKGKRIVFLPVNGNVQVDMEVMGSQEYIAPRKDGEAWPHILLEQTFQKQVRINDIKNLAFGMDAQLKYSVNKMDSASYDTTLHTAQYSMYLVVQNVNKNSADYGDYLWFGIHLYDYRWKVIEEFQQEDKGKSDATKKFIYCPESNELYKGNFQDGKWINISKDIFPLIMQAYQMAQARGYLKGSSISDMGITGMNIGWEVTGTFDCGFQFKNLELTALLKNNP
jgi:hypothetical protein